MSTPRRVLALLGGSALAATLVAPPAMASHDVTPARIAGETRYDTAAEIALQQYPDGADEVLIARATDFPDALAAAPLSATLDAPIVLTDRTSWPDRSAELLETLGATKATLLGGPAAITEQTEASIAQTNRVTTDRIFGADRYATAFEIAREVQTRNADGPNWPGGRRAAFLAPGGDFADAMTASAPAAAAGQAAVPILLTDDDHLPAATQDALKSLQIDLAIIVGGPHAISERVVQQVDDANTDITRVAGQTRTGTAAAMADFAIQHRGFEPVTIELARGDLFPDSLTLGPLAGSLGHPILLARDPGTLSRSTTGWLSSRCGGVGSIRAVGGDAAITTATLEAAEQAAENCHDREDDAVSTGEGSGLPVTVTSIDVGEHDTFDRVVFELAGDGLPGWTARYVAEATEQGSGHTIDVAGDATLELMIDNVEYPPSDDRLATGTRVPGAGAVEEVYFSNIYEAISQAFIGVDARSPIEVFTLTDPARLVVDIHHAASDG